MNTMIALRAMNPKHHFISIFSLILLACFMANPALGDDQSDKAIALWVADQTNLSQPFDMPIRHYVNKATLGLAFEVGNKKSYFRWLEEYGEDKAVEILEEYLDNIVGLFNETTEIIYVANFIEPCSQQAIFAHEMTHYFQHLTDGIIPAESYGADMKHLKREMEAYGIEEKYRKAFCQVNKAAVPALKRISAEK